MRSLSNSISFKRRYTRSVNLERDLEVVDSVLGYVPTTRAIDTLERILNSLRIPGSARAWTLTGVYGTGKSSFAHFLCSLCAPTSDTIRNYANKIASEVFESEEFEYNPLDIIPNNGLIRAVVTAQREPVSNTIVKALHRGASIFWKNESTPPKVLKTIAQLIKKVNNGEIIENHVILAIVHELVRESNTGILLIIDELGKVLEHAARNQSINDLFLLQQLAELPSGVNDPKVLLLGLLHQSFVDYTNEITTAQRNEWGKIQGRFEDIPFVESQEQAIRLIGNAIDFKGDEDFKQRVAEWAMSWYNSFEKRDGFGVITFDNIREIYPLHPISALILPVLCNRYAQNDRSLFSFLTSDEPYSFANFLRENDSKVKHSVTLKLDRLYDYFLENAGMSMSSRSQLQRWVEINGRISEARQLELNAISVLKTIGLLNLVSSSGSLKASRDLVILALCDDPKDQSQKLYWDELITVLISKNYIVYRKQIDELRIWEGSDFDVEEAIREQIDKLNLPLADMLSKYFPLNPIVAQRHSYITGTLRYFERIFVDDSCKLESLSCQHNDSDGLVCYWSDDTKNLQTAISISSDGKPVVFIATKEIQKLKTICYEFVALERIEETAPQLQSDGVARKEVRQRLAIAKRQLSETLSRVFDVSNTQATTCYILGEEETFNSRAEYNSRLSDLCDMIYEKGPTLWNEMINRRELTTQGATARKKLLEALLQNVGQEKLGITGYGPERSMFESLLGEPGIYSFVDGEWCITAPSPDSGVYSVWNAIKEFCLEANESPVKVSELYDILSRPPYGVKKEIIPILLGVVLLYHAEDICLYLDGSFIPKIGPEHFELLVKQPYRYTVKHIQMAGIKGEVFIELETALRKSSMIDNNLRNWTLLAMVNPLVQFAMKLPKYTANTKSLSKETLDVRKTLREAREPDTLLFHDLPRACGLPEFNGLHYQDESVAREFRNKLVTILNELQTAYDRLLNDCKMMIHNAFGMQHEAKLRESLMFRASRLVGKCVEPRLRSFIHAAANDFAEDKVWLESLVMIVADKPAQSFSDQDVDQFEMNLANMARRFKNFEDLQQELEIPIGNSLTAKRITVTSLDGHDKHRTIWMDLNDKELVDNLADMLMLQVDQLTFSDQIKEATLVRMMEKLVSTSNNKVNNQ